MPKYGKYPAEKRWQNLNIGSPSPNVRHFPFIMCYTTSTRDFEFFKTPPIFPRNTVHFPKKYEAFFGKILIFYSVRS